MNGGWRWARADLRRRWVSVLALGLLIAFACGATMSLVAGARRAGSAVERFAAVSDLADITVFVGSEPSADLLHAIDSDDRISRTERSDLAVIAPESIAPGEDGLTAIGSTRVAAGGLGVPMLLSGRYPSPDATNEMLANERAATDFGFKAGDRTTLHGLACYECDPAAIPGEVTITGIGRLANDLVHDPTTTALFLAPPTFLGGAWKDQVRPGTIIWVHLHDQADALEVSQELSGLVAEGDVSSNTSSLNVAGRSADVQRNALLVAAALVGVVSLFVLGQAMARFASVRHADEPVLAALGLTREQRSRAVFLLLAPSLLIGSALAAFVAIMLSPLFPFGVARRADPDPGFHADASVLVVGVAVSLLLAIVLAAFIARRWVVHERGSRHAPAAVSTKLANLGLSPVPLTGVRFALERGGGRSRPPTRSTVAAIVIAMVVVTGALVVRSSIDGLGADPARYGQSWAIAVTTDGDLREIAEKVAQDRRIAAVDLMAQGELDLSASNDTSAQIGVVGIQGLASPAAVGMLEGRAPSGLGEIALGSVTMRELGVHIGDEIVASGPCGTRRLDVTGRAIVPLVGGDSPDEGAVVTLDSYSELCADQLIAEIDLNRNMLVHLNDDRQLDAVAADLRAEGLDVELSTRPSSVDALFGIREVTAIVSLIVGSLGLAVVTYALLLSVRRRRGELAVLRALGFRPAQTGAVLSAQAATLVVVGIVLGLPLGVIAGRLLWKAIAEPSNVIVRSDVGLIVIVAAVAMAVLIGAVSLWPSWRARRIDVASALRSE